MTSTIRLEVQPAGEVHVPVGTTLAELRPELARVLLRPELAHAPLTVNGAPVRDDHRTGVRPLLAGAALGASSPRGPSPRGPSPRGPSPRGPSTRAGDRARTAASHQQGPDAVLRARWHVAVVAGPDAGTLHVVPPGRGRVHDLRVRASVRGVRVTPPRTARWYGRDRRTPRTGRTLWTGRPRRWRPGRVLVIDGEHLCLRPRPRSLGPEAPADASDSGPAREPRRPGPPARTLLAGAVPAAAGIALAAALRQPMLAAFAVIGPLGMLASWWTTRPARERGTAATSGPSPADACTRVLMRSFERPAERDRDARGQAPTGGRTDPRTAVEARPQHLPTLPDDCLAVIGPSPLVGALARSIVADQVVAGRRVVIANPARHTDDWAWTRWLPTPDRPGAGPAGSPSDRPDGEPLVVVDARGVVDTGDARGAVPTGLPVGYGQVLVLTGDSAHVPAWCRATAHVEQDYATAVRSVVWRSPSQPRRVEPFAGTSVAWCEQLARAVAALPRVRRPDRLRSSSLAGLLDLAAEPADTSRILSRWSAASARGLSAVVGTGPAGPTHLDLVDDGPHALIAGTTGSGKSELLQTLVLSLATQYRPSDLAFALVDFKGGASFGACARLPHVVGSVTDLDAGLAARALAGLRAELVRRERLLLAAGRTRLDAPLDTPGGRLGRLVVVVDEFRALADDLPDFVPGLLRLAAQGRSLGMHLVLATQRPAGAVTGDLRANLALRIALRVTDPADSLDVVGVPDAARLAPEPGLAVVKRGSGEIEHLRVAHASARPGRELVRLAAPWGTPVPVDVGRGDGTGSADATAALVDACVTAARTAGDSPQRAPWAPPLPTTVEAPEPARPPSADGPASEARHIGFALVDVPDEQRHSVAAWDPAAGALAVVGRRRSGRTTALSTVAAAWLDAGRTVHVLAEDTAPWSALMARPGAGTLAAVNDPVRSARLVRALAGSDVAGRGLAGMDLTDDLLVVDGWESARAQLAVLARGAGADLLDDLVARRPGCAVSASSVPRGTLSNGPRVLLGTGDRHDDFLLGIPPALAGAKARPGRGVLIDGSGEHACQVAVPRPDRRAAARGATERRGLTSLRIAPLRLAGLPEHVALAHLGPVATPMLALGVGGDRADVVALDPSDGILVVGPPGSGRTTTLATLAHGAARDGRLRCVVSTDVSLLDVARSHGIEAVDMRRLGGTQVAAVVGAALDRPGFVVVDGLDDVYAADPRACDEWGAPALLAARPGRLLASSSIQAALGGTRGPVAALRRSHRGVLLAAHLPGAGDVFGVDVRWLAAPNGARPGRAVVVDRFSAVGCQVATPPPPANQRP